MIRFLLSAFLVCAVAAGFEGEVVGVSDGDTISVMQDGKAVKVRLSGIDCPEKKQAFGQKAKEFTSAQVMGKIVTVVEGGKDRYGRMIGTILLADGTNVNHAIVSAGLAWHYTKYSKDETLGAAEAQAKAAKLGLWADAEPVAPWKWRKRGKGN